MSLLTAVLVAFTQVIPEHQVQIMGVIKTRVKVNALAVLVPAISILTCSIAITNGISHIFNSHDNYWFPMPLHHHPICMASVLGVVTLL